MPTTQTKALYSACADAARQLSEAPPSEHGGLFTELDVIALASSPSWDDDDYRRAMRQASQVCGLLYRNRKLCRYGPVNVVGISDYARIATKIAYADAENGPRVFSTPNGTFKRLLVEGDTLGHQGRRAGTNRDDLVPWDEQKINTPRRSPDTARIRELETRLQQLTQRNQTLVNRNAWLESQQRDKVTR